MSFFQCIICEFCVLTCKSCIIIPISFICRRKKKVVKMSTQLHDCTNTFLITRLFMFLEIICTYSECKSKLKRTVEKRRGGEVKAALLLLLFPAPAHIREGQKQVSASPKPLGRCALPGHGWRGLLQGPQGNLCRLLCFHTWMLPL